MKTHNHDAKDHKSHIADGTRALLAATANATEETVVEARNRLQSVLDSAEETYTHLKERAVDGAKAADKKFVRIPIRLWASHLALALYWAFCGAAEAVIDRSEDNTSGASKWCRERVRPPLAG